MINPGIMGNDVAAPVPRGVKSRDARPGTAAAAHRRPRGKTMAPAAFAYKQLLHEPFIGGGLVLLISSIAISSRLIFRKPFLSEGRKFFRPQQPVQSRRHPEAQEPRVPES